METTGIPLAPRLQCLGETRSIWPAMMDGTQRESGAQALPSQGLESSAEPVRTVNAAGMLPGGVA